MPLRHCERSEAIHLAAQRKNGLLRRFAPRNDGVTLSVIASAAKQSMPLQKDGLLRRCAPLRKRFAFVAGNDGVTLSVIASQRVARMHARQAPRSNPCLSVIASEAKQSISLRKERWIASSLR